MSKLSELVEREAAAAEAEAEQEQQESDPQTAVEPDAAQPAAPSEKDLKALEREFERHEAALKRIMGADYERLSECPVCAGQIPGYVWEPPDQLAIYRADPNKTTCPACDGYGQLRSGSRTAAALVMCMTCAGNGYVERVQAATAFAQQVAGGGGSVPPGYLPPSSEATPPLDSWGRTLGHPHFGIDPAQIGV